jgi:signal transduction histidine kinase
MALVSNVLASMLPPQILDSRYFTATIVLADTVWITAALVSSGRFETYFFLLYFFVLVLAATGERLGLIAVASVLICLVYAYVLSSSGENWSMWNSPSIIRLPFLFTSAAFYGYMVDRTRRGERRAAAASAKAQAYAEALTTVSRQLRAPMTSVLSWSNLLLDTRLTAPQREYAERVRRCGEELVAVADGILDVAVIQAGEVRVEAVAFEPSLVVEEVCTRTASKAAEKRITLVQRVHPLVPHLLHGPQRRIRQVLAVLVDQMIAITESCEVVVAAHVVGTTLSHVTVRFGVRCVGGHIPAVEEAVILATLGVAESSERDGTTGVDLAVAKRLVSAMEGEVGFDRDAERGSALWFAVRLAEVAATDWGASEAKMAG